MTSSVTRTFNDLYAHELEMLISAETQMIALLPSLAAGTDTGELKSALTAQTDICQEQLQMLNGLLEDLRKDLQKSLHLDLHRPHTVLVSRGIRSLLEECSDLLKSFPTGNLRDAVMIAHMQRAEHYKIAAYASVQDYAKLLGFKAAADQLAQAGRKVLGVSRNLGAISIQINAEAYVDTRLEKT